MLILRKVKSQNDVPTYSYPTIKGRWGKSTGLTAIIGSLVSGCFTLNVINLWFRRPAGVGPAYGLIFLIVVLAATNCFYISAGIYMFLMDRKFAKLSSYEQLCKRFGLETEQLRTAVQTHNIKPRCIVNDENYYDLKDFGDATTLLRASMKPIARPETLLRPAAHNDTSPEILLRAATPATQNEQAQSQSAGGSPLL